MLDLLRILGGAYVFFQTDSPAIFLLSTQSGASAPKSQEAVLSHPVTFTIEYDGGIVGTPKLELIDGQAAIMAVERANGYSLRVLLSRINQGGALRAQIETELYLERQGKWVPIASPTISAPFGGTASYELPAQSNAKPSLRITYDIGAPHVVTRSGKSM